MAELKARGEDWQSAWRSHPVAIAYRELLKRAWMEPHRPGADPRYHWSVDQGRAMEARLTQPEGLQATGSATDPSSSPSTAPCPAQDGATRTDACVSEQGTTGHLTEP